MNGTARPERTALKALSSLGTAWQGRESPRTLGVLRFFIASPAETKGWNQGSSGYVFISSSSSSSSSFCPPGDLFRLTAHAWSSSAECQLFSLIA